MCELLIQNGDDFKGYIGSVLPLTCFKNINSDDRVAAQRLNSYKIHKLFGVQYIKLTITFNMEILRMV